MCNHHHYYDDGIVLFAFLSTLLTHQLFLRYYHLLLKYSSFCHQHNAAFCLLLTVFALIVSHFNFLPYFSFLFRFSVESLLNYNCVLFITVLSMDWMFEQIHSLKSTSIIWIIIGHMISIVAFQHLFGNNKSTKRSVNTAIPIQCVIRARIVEESKKEGRGNKRRKNQKKICITEHSESSIET